MRGLLKGVDCFITGEPKHTHYHLAQEAGLNVIYGGHYHSETLGVKVLERFSNRNSGSKECFCIF